jgi:hypothetical protein
MIFPPNVTSEMPRIFCEDDLMNVKVRYESASANRLIMYDVIVGQQVPEANFYRQEMDGLKLAGRTFS